MPKNNIIYPKFCTTCSANKQDILSVNLIIKGLILQRIQWVASALFLITGGVIYLLFRPLDLIMFDFIRIVGLENIIINFRDLMSDCNLTYFIVYNLPMSLWIISYMLAIDAIWDTYSRQYFFWLLILPYISIISEGLQKTQIIDGTYDLNDQIALIGGVITFVFYKFMQQVFFYFFYKSHTFKTHKTNNHEN